MKKVLMILPLCCFVLAIVANHSVFAYESKAMYSSQQLLDHSLDELRAAMLKAKESNEDLKNQTEILRQEAAQLEDGLAQTEPTEETDVLSEDAVIEDEELAQKERTLYESRLENLAARQERLNAHNKRLAKNIEAYQQDTRETESKIAALRKDVSDTQIAMDDVNNFQTSKTPESDAKIKKNLAAKKDQIRSLEKKLAMQKQALEPRLALKQKFDTKNAQLEKEIESNTKELSRLQGGVYVAKQQQKTDSEFRKEIADLEEYRNDLRESVDDLRKAAIAAKSTKTQDLSKVLEVYRQQQAVLKQQLAAIDTPEAMAKRKNSLVQENKNLRMQIAQIENTAAQSDSREAVQAQLKLSHDRIAFLTKQIASLRNDSPLQKQYDELSGQIAVLEKDLQNLRENPSLEMIATPKDAKTIKQEITDLEARRVILAKSVQDVYEKYNLKELPGDDPVAKETRMKDYFETLRVENSALQQKVLTLQMKQDKIRQGFLNP